MLSANALGCLCLPNSALLCLIYLILLTWQTKLDDNFWLFAREYLKEKALHRTSVWFAVRPQRCKKIQRLLMMTNSVTRFLTRRDSTFFNSAIFFRSVCWSTVVLCVKQKLPQFDHKFITHSSRTAFWVLIFVVFICWQLTSQTWVTYTRINF